MGSKHALATFALAVIATILSGVEGAAFGGPRRSLITRLDHPVKRDACVRSCMSAAGVPYIDSNSPEYNAFVFNYTFNVRLPVVPIAIAQPTTRQHVSDAVVCAANASVKVQARSGGHSYANFGLGGQDGSLVIDLVNFQAYALNGTVAKVGGGTKLGYMAQKLYKDGRALPHGTCAGVGIGGHATHGGYGYASRAWGMALDRIVGLDVVLANGTMVHTTSTKYPDLYYALRGAADSFGIVLNFYFDTVPAPPTSVNFFWNFAGLNNNSEAATAALMNLQDFALSSSLITRNLSFGILFTPTVWSVRGIYLGTDEEFAPLRKQMLAGLPDTLPSSTSRSLTWLESLITMNDGVTINPPKYENDTFYVKSVVVPESSPITADAAKSYFSYAISEGQSAGAEDWFSIINLYGGYDSQITAKLGGDSASDHDRDALWVLQHYTSYKGHSGPFPQTATSFIAGLNDALEKPMPGTEFGAYANYVDPSLSADQAHGLYFGSEIYAKLVALKKEFDPQNVFWNPQAVVA